MKHFSIISLFLFVIFGQTFSQPDLLTTAERSNYASTSTYDDVMQFIETIIQNNENARLEIIATSVEGRDIPLVILADPMPSNPLDLKNDDRIVVYLQANIHAGEVEGKEATQMLMRDLLKEMPKHIFDNAIILVCPILNADGNEKFSIKNRTNQVGPVKGVGVRHNGQYLDLNRDAMKLETPEIRGVVSNIFNRWDPAITVDCHTTNGSYHEEPVTFTWMMNPNGDRDLINFMRDDLMLDVHKNLLDKYNVENIFYGEFLDRMNVDTGWISYASEPRYLVNYVGVRNRLSILNENYVYADFETRVKGSYFLLKTILEYAAENKKTILNILNKADQKMMTRHVYPEADSFAIEYKGIPTPEKITIKAIEADTIPGMTGYWSYKQSNRKKTVTVPYIADYFPTKSIAVPFAYLMAVPDPDVLENLKTHGIEFTQLNEDITLEVERFEIEEIEGAKRLFQGHYNNKMKGKFVVDTIAFSKGTHIIYSAQKLGNVASYLLEPQSDDGYVVWNYFDRYLVPQWSRSYYPYPVYRLMKPMDLP
ncbi:MAG: M14 family metallopeptidase [Bacteroidales bacterium]